MKHYIFPAVCALLLSLSLVGCENAEVKAIAKAQTCLDAVPASDGSSASACFSYVEKYTSQQANILKCSIKLTSGGLTTNKMIEVYQISDDSAVSDSQKQVAYLGALNLTSSALAQEAYGYCVLSEVSGLKFIAGLARISSMFGVSYDPNDVAGSTAAIAASLDACVTGGGCDLAATGEIIEDLSDSYCSSPSSDKDVCEDINKAIDEAGGDTQLAAKKFLCHVQKKTYNGSACI